MNPSYDRDRVRESLIIENERAFKRLTGREPTPGDLEKQRIEVERMVRELTEKGWLR